MSKYKALKRRLWVLYRITPDEQRRIEEYQRSYFPLLLGRNMGTDHDHATGLIRGRLDWRINKALGLIEKVGGNPAAILRELSEYMSRPPAVSVIGKRYGLIGKAQYKKKMIYGPPE